MLDATFQRTWWAATALALAACSGADGGEAKVVPVTFVPVQPLSAAQVDLVLQRAVNSLDPAVHDDVAAAVVDRRGNVLRLYRRGIGDALGVPPGSVPSIGDLDPVAQEEDLVALDFATSIARTAAFLSHSQAPLTSRTGQFLATFHFPGVFATSSYLTDPPLVFPGQTIPLQQTVGVKNTPLAPLWQIDASNRGTFFAESQDGPSDPTLTMPPTFFEPGAAIPVLAGPDGSAPSPGFGPLPGGVPLYADGLAPADVGRRLVGAIGVLVRGDDGLPRPDVAEAAAFEGAKASEGGNPFHFLPPIPNEGAVFLVGILLPYLFQTAPPDVLVDGGGSFFDPRDQVVPDGETTTEVDGTVDPVGDLIAPRSSAVPGGLTFGEVETILQACRKASTQTHAAIRLPATSPCKMIITVCDTEGVILGTFREEDATLFSFEISITKARNAIYFSSPESRIVDDPDIAGPLAGKHPLTGFLPLQGPGGDFLDTVDPDGNVIAENGTVVDVFPESALTTKGVAVTARTLGFLSAPFFPPTIDGSGHAGPLHYLVLANRNPAAFEKQGLEGPPPQPQTRSGIIFFPGSAPLYRDGVLVGGVGVSGDGVEQDDLVTALGIQLAEQGFTGVDDKSYDPIGFSLEPPPEIRADAFSYQGVGIPYFKFPQNPEG